MSAIAILKDSLEKRKERLKNLYLWLDEKRKQYADAVNSVEELKKEIGEIDDAIIRLGDDS